MLGAVGSDGGADEERRVFHVQIGVVGDGGDRVDQVATSSITAQTSWATLIASFADGGSMPSSVMTVMNVSSTVPAEATPAEAKAAESEGGR